MMMTQCRCNLIATSEPDPRLQVQYLKIQSQVWIHVLVEFSVSTLQRGGEENSTQVSSGTFNSGDLYSFLS